MGRFYQTAVVTLAIVLAGAAVFAQATTGDISGTVRDQSHAVLPGTTVEVKNVETGAVRALVCDNDGRYRALGLPPGAYAVTASLSGFNKAEARDVVVQIGRDTTVDLTMTVGQVTEAVTVSGEVSLLDLSGATVGGVVTTKQIADTHQTSAALIALSRDSRAEVDGITDAAIAAGGRQTRDTDDMGFMYSRPFEDLDGHTFEPMYMDMEAFPAATTDQHEGVAA